MKNNSNIQPTRADGGNTSLEETERDQRSR